MQNNIRKQFVQLASVLLLAHGTITAAHAVSEPIQTQRGVVRLGSKTQANVDAKGSSVAISEGMVLISSNPGRLGRPALKVSFNGAPMHVKVQGTALIAYMSGKFIQITGVEGRTYLVREGRLGENVAIDAGKMLLVKPAAKRLPETADIDLGYFVENSPMFNGGLKLAASSLIARAIEKQSGNRYLKSTPIYFEGAGSEAVIASENPELPSIGDGLGDEGQPLDTSLTGIDSIERIPTRLAEPQLVAAAQSTASPRGGGGSSGGVAPGAATTVSTTALPPADVAPGRSVPPVSGPLPPPPNTTVNEVWPGFGRVNDSPGGPVNGSILGNQVADPPSRGFLKEFKGTAPNNELSIWFPMTVADEDILKNDIANPRAASPIKKTGNGGLVQGANLTGNDAGEPRISYTIFPEARIPDAMATTPLKITPLYPSNIPQTERKSAKIILKFSNQDIPSDLLESSQFKERFKRDPAGVVSEVIVGGRPVPIDEFAPLDKSRNPPRLGMTLVVPPEGITIKDRFFKTDTITQPNEAIDREAGKFPVIGLYAPEFMGSVLVGVTSGPSVKVEVGDRQGSNALNGGLFSLQAPPSQAAPSASSDLTIESDGLLGISDPSPGAMTGTTVISKQSIGVQSSAGELVFSNSKLNADQEITVSSLGQLVFSEAILNAGQGIAVSSSGQLVFSKAILNSGQGLAVSSSGELVFSETTLNAGQGIAVSSPVVMQGAGTAALKMLNSTVTAPNGEVHITGGDLAFTNTKLNAGQGIAVSSSGELVFSETTLNAGQGLAVSSPVVMQGAGTAALKMLNSTVTAPNGEVRITGGDLVFTNTKLKAGRRIAVSSPKRIRFENSSQLAALTAIFMEGGGTNALEVVNLVITAPNDEILIDQFDRIQIGSLNAVLGERATLMASVIRARVVSPSGVLQISNATLSAGELLRLYAEGSSGMVEFNGAVKLKGKTIQIAGDTVRVNAGGNVMADGNTTVYANPDPDPTNPDPTKSKRQYNKAGFGKISSHTQGNFVNRPQF